MSEPPLQREQLRLVAWQSFMAAYLTLVAGGGLADIIGEKLASLLALLGAAMNAGTATYVAGRRPPDTPPRQSMLIKPDALP